MKRLFATLALALMSIGANAQSPNDIIEEAVDEISSQLSVRRQELESDPQALYAMIDEILLPRFDRRYAAQLVLGKHWRTASEQQRNDFIDAFYKSLLKKYADSLLEFDEDKVMVLPFRGDESKSRTVVRTEVRLDDGTKVPVNYGLVKRASGWLMFDVVVEGISYVRNFRVELNSEIQASSLDAVIERLRSDVAVAEGA
ncbi:MAG: ABC transporter substrate-binding protein [Gammaproteobacteria bacterium]|nr:ABC transporter substrate-binding protein [Gammaproteobacteria bacterium]